MALQATAATDHNMSKSVDDPTLAAALTSGNKLELSCFGADQNVDVIYKKKEVSVYKLVRFVCSTLGGTRTGSVVYSSSKQIH